MVHDTYDTFATHAMLHMMQMVHDTYDTHDTNREKYTHACVYVFRRPASYVDIHGQNRVLLRRHISSIGNIRAAVEYLSMA